MFRKQSQIVFCKSLFICECAVSVGIIFTVEGTAVQPHVFSTVSASLFTYLVGVRVK